MKVRIKARVRVDLLAVRRWSETQWGVARAQDFLEELIESIERLADNPQMGRARESFGKGLRSLRHRGYMIFYMLDAEGPVIVAVVHERRNHAALSFGDMMEGV